MDPRLAPRPKGSAAPGALTHALQGTAAHFFLGQLTSSVPLIVRSGFFSSPSLASTNFTVISVESSPDMLNPNAVFSGAGRSFELTSSRGEPASDGGTSMPSDRILPAPSLT